MDGYLTKPIDENALISLLTQWTQGQAAPNPAPRLSPIPAPTSNQSIHWQHAVQQSAGKIEIAQELLQMLVDSARRWKPVLIALLKKETTTVR